MTDGLEVEAIVGDAVKRARVDAFNEAAELCEREASDAKEATRAQGASRCAYRLRQKAKQELAKR